tara:strand:- start:30114 stop:30848 length:735 start_codon:yes stop_codon:yes gene_type:complete
MIDLSKIDTFPPGDSHIAKTKKSLKKLRKELFQLQNKFYADGRYSILIILQGVDASGKDGTIRHAFSSMNPQGVQVKSFKKPTEDERQHDFLWRIYPHFPEKGMIKIFNRSYYEDILVPSVEKTLSEDVLQHRINLINELEHHLGANNTVILKFYLHLSEEEQKKRIDERKTKPHKKWKYAVEDELIPGQWEAYRTAHHSIINNCNQLPWHIVPADKRWYRNWFVANKLLVTLEQLNLTYQHSN